MPAGRRVRRGLVLAALLVCAPAWADFESDYVAGLAALDHGDYAGAQSYLKKAIEAQPNPVRSVEVNGVKQPYLPHHFLGMAALRSGDCATARKEWESSINQRMIGRLNMLRRSEQSLLEGCQQQVVARPNPQTPQTTQAPQAPSTSGQNAHGAQADSTAAPSAPVTPPAALVRAFADYVAGRYGAVMRIDPQQFARSRARYQAYLLRCAARFARSRLDGTDEGLVAARADARAAWALDKSVPDTRVFSPQFLSFYRASH